MTVALPIVAAEFERNSREVVRVSIDEYRGRKIIDVRTWYRDGAALKPGRSGISIALGHLPALVGGLQMAVARAKAAGLLDDAREAGE